MSSTHRVLTAAAMALVALVLIGLSFWDDGVEAIERAAAPVRPPSEKLPQKAVLDNVPRVGFDVRNCPLPGSVEAVLTYLGETPDFDMIQCVSGAAFRRFYNKNDGGNVDLMYLGEGVLSRTFAALGYAYEHVSPANREQLVAGVKRSIAAGRPVIAFGIIGPPEACIITGYEDDGETLLGWNYFQEDRSRYFVKSRWEPCTEQGLGFVTVGEKQQPPSARETLVAVLRLGVELEGRATRNSHPNHVTGTAALDAWAADLENDVDFPAGDRKTLETRKMILGDQLAMSHNRSSAAEYFRRMAGEFPEAADPLNEAAASYAEVGRLCGEMYRDGAAFDLGQLAQRAFRQELSALARETRLAEENAMVEMEKALNILDPLPSADSLVLPGTDGPGMPGSVRRRAPESMPLAVAMRASSELMSLRLGGDDAVVPLGDNWFVSPAQAFMMGVTGQAFDWYWLPRPGEQIKRGYEFYLQDGNRPFLRAASAMGRDVEVRVGNDWGGKAVLPSEAEVRREIMEAVHRRGEPVLLISDTDYFVVAGYQENGAVLTGWRAAPGGPTIDLQSQPAANVRDWYSSLRCMVMFHGPVSARTGAQVYRTALEDAVNSLSSVQAGPYYGGQEMHQAWARAIVDPAIGGDSPEAARARTQLVDPLIWDLAERRWYGQLFLNQAHGYAPEAARDDLLRAGAHFRSIHDLMYDINRACGAQAPGERLPLLGNQEVRASIAELIRQAAQHDADALESIKSALAKWP